MRELSPEVKQGQWTPEWNSEFPTEPGTYLFRSHPSFQPQEIELRVSGRDLVFDVMDALRVFDRPALKPEWAKLPETQVAGTSPAHS